jgi:hypothetical protein
MYIILVLVLFVCFVVCLVVRLVSLVILSLLCVSSRVFSCLVCSCLVAPCFFSVLSYLGLGLRLVASWSGLVLWLPCLYSSLSYEEPFFSFLESVFIAVRLGYGVVVWLRTRHWSCSYSWSFVVVISIVSWSVVAPRSFDLHFCLFCFPATDIMAAKENVVAFQSSLNEWVADIMTKEGIHPDYVPIVGSIDIRQDSKGRVCAIDPNRYPQGFNNVSVEDFVKSEVSGHEIESGRIMFELDAAALLRRRISAGRIHVVEEGSGFFLFFRRRYRSRHAPL